MLPLIFTDTVESDIITHMLDADKNTSQNVSNQFIIEHQNQFEIPNKSHI